MQANPTFLGPKALAGYAQTDNGFARFDRVRIPKENMLSRFAQVTDEGKYLKPPHAKLSYGGVSKVQDISTRCFTDASSRCFIFEPSEPNLDIEKGCR